MSLCKVLLPMLLVSAGCTASPPEPRIQASEPVPPPAERMLVRPSADGIAELEVGQVMEIALQGNASTGYAWDFEADGAPVVLRAPPMPRPAPTPEGDGDAGQRPMVGSPSVQRWHFVGHQPGEATLRMVYRRPWEKTVAPARTAVFKVVVREVATP